MKIDFSQQTASKTNQELIDIFINPVDYQQDFIIAVKEELIKRNIDLKEYEQKKEQTQKTVQEKLEKGIDGNPLYIGLGFISAFLGGFLGIIAGYIYSQSKHKTETKNYYVYNEATRKKGIIMMFIGIIALLILIILKLE